LSRDEYISEEQLAKMSLPADEAYNLPKAAYVSEHIFKQESEHLFKANWINIAHVNQLAKPGDYLSIDVFDYPLLLTRDKNNDIHLMSRVCQHKGTLIAEGSGNAHIFVCPFHAWSYGLDGQLKAAPLMDKAKGFDRQNCRLTQLRMEIWGGFIFVNISGDAEPLSPQLTDVQKILANWKMDELVPTHEPRYYDQQQNWKVNAESFLESYHHLGAHVKTFQPTYAAANGYPVASTGSYSIFSFGPAQGSAATNIDGGSGFPFFEGLTEAECLEPMVVFIWPSLLLGIGADMVAYYRVMPTSSESHDLWVNNLMARSVVENPELESAIKDRVEWAITVHEDDDMPVFDLCQHGIRSALYDQGRLSFPYERCIWEFNQWWKEQLGERILK
jgi:phenylpropionate dioxygenase-like ring-hydroxylating dioxygenase large terminal subunit